MPPDGVPPDEWNTAVGLIRTHFGVVMCAMVYLAEPFFISVVTQDTEGGPWSFAYKGYDPALGYAQTGTMTAVLSSSVERMEEDSRKLGDALDRLSQLLSSLPVPEAPPPAAKEVTSPERKKR